MPIVTLIAADRLSRGDISAAGDALRLAGVEPASTDWVEEGSACDLAFDGEPATARAALEPLAARLDFIVQPAEGRRRRMLVADMDSTMIGVECIDELADFAGVRAEVAEITERAMCGELDFEAALDARVALLEGLDVAVIDRCREERVRLMPGARALVRTMRREGAYCLLVSGGFSRFAGPVAESIGFDASASNELVIDRGKLLGTVQKPIIGALGKLEAMMDAAAGRNIALEAVLAVGDGANDIPMLQAAGLGIAYRAKPAAAAAADGRIEHGDLTALLFAQGYKRSEWEADQD